MRERGRGREGEWGREGEGGKGREGEIHACLQKIFFYVCLDAFCVLYLAKIYSTILVQNSSIINVLKERNEMDGGDRVCLGLVAVC